MRSLFAIALLGIAGCLSSSDVREITIHIGYTSDRSAQYLEPKEIRVKQGEKIRFVITNDDKPGSPDSFHDVAFRYGDYGLIEHEVPAGKTTKTCIPQSDPETVCAPEKSYFVASIRGRFKLYCEVGPLGSVNPDGTPKTRHEQMGMWGTLVVE